jgi:uncharacterized membrane protein YesL
MVFPMFGFLIKKTFFDMWDNMFRVILMNVGFMAILAIFVMLLPAVAEIAVLPYVVLVLGIALLAVYMGAVSRMANDIADYKQPGFADFWQHLKQSLPTSLLFALVVSAYVVIIKVAFGFYGAMQSIIGPIAVSVLFWVTVIALLASQFFFPIQSRLDNKFRKVVKKSFLILLDNPGFTIVLFLCAILTSALSFFIAFIVPGFATVFLLWNVGFKLRLYKYDYLEKNPGADRRKIPWDALLVEDRERVGKRTLKGMIFPWKQ